MAIILPFFCKENVIILINIPILYNLKTGTINPERE